MAPMRAVLLLLFICLGQGLEYHAEHQAEIHTPLSRRQKHGGQHVRYQRRPQDSIIQVEIGAHAQQRKVGQAPVTVATPLKDMSSEYTGYIGVGTTADGKSQFQARVVFDTGSTNLWVASVLCEEYPCTSESASRFYDPAKSLTQEQFVGQHEDIDITFGTGELKGPLHTDTYRVGPMEVKKQSFAMIREMTGSVFSSFPFEGILGLAFPSLSFGGIEPFFETVIKQKLLKNNEFAFYLNIDSSEPSALLWGGIDKDLYHGKIAMVPVSKPHYWALDLVDFRIGNKSFVKGPGGEKLKYLIVDSGTTYFTAPSFLYDDVMAKFPEANCNAVDGYEPMTFVLKTDSGTYDLKVTQETYMVGEPSGGCSPAFMKLNVAEQWGPAMILGEVFMRHFFTVFHRGSGDVKEAKIGFAPAKIGAKPKVPGETFTGAAFVQNLNEAQKMMRKASERLGQTALTPLSQA
eukprot:TRINITY_DN1952_c0_g2_i1.p1 TRINITY_DN1952_c0_g2~~TRINITY_DN1952_c0_g2_i1.p1  ORF type:complete len:489 (+),score=93.69 TRINITY_DN1952_c0_g2_i1:86-1468(+)